MFDGVAVIATVAADRPEPAVDFRFRNLRFGDVQTGADLSLGDLKDSRDANQWLRVALLRARLATESGSGRMLDAVLGVLGLSGDVPSLDWGGVFRDPQGTLGAWVRSLAASPKLLGAWLGKCRGLFDPAAKGTGAPGSSTPDGSWRIVLATHPTADLALTLAFTSDAVGVRASPGLSFAYRPGTPAFRPRPPSRWQCACSISTSPSAGL
ncbi:MAG TPA: hypothetical protein VH682_31905 [Gemmataceae bacterium]|jgi:hypothetical protein